MNWLGLYSYSLFKNVIVLLCIWRCIWRIVTEYISRLWKLFNVLKHPSDDIDQFLCDIPKRSVCSNFGLLRDATVTLGIHHWRIFNDGSKMTRFLVIRLCVLLMVLVEYIQFNLRNYEFFYWGAVKSHVVYRLNLDRWLIWTMCLKRSMQHQ